MIIPQIPSFLINGFSSEKRAVLKTQKNSNFLIFAPYYLRVNFVPYEEVGFVLQSHFPGTSFDERV
jgi:hypothetical protein